MDGDGRELPVFTQVAVCGRGKLRREMEPDDTSGR
ncbi:hypothetical protein COLO4_13718 [Corchorus olitorius]|uniref:Uncharacterized protein n=1 Tax=Corchorus olitorius TaxID=93759 RepID=A0A1R3JV50_9ROSI|nr:hypothetical protein COLO4_13718 [Corchorus olitorius]